MFQASQEICAYLMHCWSMHSVIAVASHHLPASLCPIASSSFRPFAYQCQRNHAFRHTGQHVDESDRIKIHLPIGFALHIINALCLILLQLRKTCTFNCCLKARMNSLHLAYLSFSFVCSCTMIPCPLCLEQACKLSMPAAL